MLEEKVAKVREWLGSGAINVFGLPMSGKDTVGARLAEVLGGRLLSSGEILREVEANTGEFLTKDGALTPTDRFADIVLPYFYRDELVEQPLVLSSVGRWSGEEGAVTEAAEKSGHPMKAVLLLDVSEADVWERWEMAQILADRAGRADDADRAIFEKRLAEFREKTGPVILHYEKTGLLVHVRADGNRDEVFAAAIGALAEKAFRA